MRLLLPHLKKRRNHELRDRCWVGIGIMATMASERETERDRETDRKETKVTVYSAPW